MNKKLLILFSICLMFSHAVFADWDESMPFKWVQYPDLTPNGIDINGTAFKLADDFECTTTGPLTDFHIWCSWLYDEGDPSAVDFTIEIWSDIPAEQSSTGYSMPGEKLWERDFAAGDFTVRVWRDQILEGWWDPGLDNFIFPGDTICWQYNFVLDPLDPELFKQEGTVDNPVIYWIAIQAKPLEPGPLWGWKTRDLVNDGHFNDDAVYDDGSGTWKELIYPPTHELADRSMDLAFVITGEEQQPEELDFGDAPEILPDGTSTSYPTTLANNGARHVITNGPWLGDASDIPDSELNGQPTFNADGDDNDGNDDENGVKIPVLTAGQVATITFEVNSSGGTGGTVSAWLDFDGSLSWEAAEQIVAASYPDGIYSVNVPVPNSAVIGQTFARFRISSTVVGVDGLAPDGEIEDYEVIIEEPEEKLKFQQLPMDGVQIEEFQYWGHDELSTAWHDLEDTSVLPEVYQGCYMADDFADLKDTPVIKIKWWGSYLENFYVPPSIQVDRFLIAIEKDVPAGADVEYSHPGELLLSQIVRRDVDGALTPGEFTETPYSAGGPPCNEMLFEYEAVLENPFPQDPNTVYWLKIVAMVEALPGQIVMLKQCGIPLCELGRQPWQQIVTQCPELQAFTPLIRWGWHSRDYTKMDPYASVPPAVVPGEHVQGVLFPGTINERRIWHFQDDAVTGEVLIDEATPEMPLVEQPDWFEEYYKFKWDLCPDDTRGVDGPQGIEEYSKDLAFELWTTTGCTCFGDQDGNGVVTLTELLAFINIMQANGFADTAVSPGEECFDQDGNVVLTLTELLALINLLQPGGFADVPCP